MPVIHINRQGSRYYLHTGPKKGGGLQHFFSRKPKGALADTIPEGYEIYENVNAGVYLRRKKAQLIREEEVEEIRQGLLKLKGKKRYKTEARAKHLTIHEGSAGLGSLDPHEPFGFLTEIFSGINPGKLSEANERFATYQPVMRFVLVDGEKRIFAPERYCFKGSVEDWIDIGPPDTLTKLASKYLKHLGKDSFFELY